MIGRLVEISTTPISMELKITPAKREIKTDSASYNMDRNTGGLAISHQYPKINIDTSESRASLGLKSVYRSRMDFADQCVQDATQAIQQTVDEGSTMMNDTSGANMQAEFAKQNAQSVPDVQLNFLPSTPANIDWEPPQLDMRYEMDRMNFDWHTSNEPEIEFTPAKVEYLVKEYPKVEIKYIGKPLYVPPSAEPGYVPPELDVTA